MDYARIASRYVGIALVVLALGTNLGASGLSLPDAPLEQAKGKAVEKDKKKDDRKDDRLDDRKAPQSDTPAEPPAPISQRVRPPRFGPMKNLKSELALINQRLDLLTGQVTELRTDVDTIQASLQSQINTIQTTLATQQSQLTGISGKVTTLEGATASFQAGLAANTATIAALQTAIASLEELMESTRAAQATDAASQEALANSVHDIEALIQTHQSMIVSLKQQQDRLAVVMQNIALGNCGAGKSMQGIDESGMVTCTTAGGSTGGLSTLTVEVWRNLQYGENTLSAYCPDGYVTTSAGFWAPTHHESVAFVSNVNYTWFYWDLGFYWRTYNPPPHDSYGTEKAEEQVTIPVPVYSYLQRSPISVTSSQAWPNRATAQATYTPHTSDGSWVYWAVYATCLKLQ